MFTRIKKRFIEADGPDVNAGRPGVKSSTAKKIEYSRPSFLQLLTPDELKASADHSVRPIIVPRDISLLPWGTGYAECVNSGKSMYNEDQAAFFRQVLSDPTHKHPDLPFTYFGIFDGHAGTGAALAAANHFHYILHEKLVDIIDLLLKDDNEDNATSTDGIPKRSILYRKVTKDELIMGALESAFFHMDSLIAEDSFRYANAGGCTACVVLFINGKMYVANAGDSRAVLCQRRSIQSTNANSATCDKAEADNKNTLNAYPVPFSFDHTPETERQRLMNVALCIRSGLSSKGYAPIEFVNRPRQDDLGKPILCRKGAMKGWAYKTFTRADLKMPIVSGEGKRSRLLGTLGVTRGFGDHDLLTNTGFKLKLFLTPLPDVTHRDLTKIVSIPGENNEDGDYGILVMATDGLWDVSENEFVANTVFKTLVKYPTEKYRYTMAAQELVAKARGSINESGHWRLNDGKAATSDDISVLVIPVYQYYKEHIESEKRCAEEARERLKAATVMATEAKEMPVSSPTALMNGMKMSNDNNNMRTVNILEADGDAVDDDDEEEDILIEVVQKQQAKALAEEESESADSSTSEASTVPLLASMITAMADTTLSTTDEKGTANSRKE